MSHTGKGVKAGSEHYGEPARRSSRPSPTTGLVIVEEPSDNEDSDRSGDAPRSDQRSDGGSLDGTSRDGPVPYFTISSGGHNGVKGNWLRNGAASADAIVVDRASESPSAAATPGPTVPDGHLAAAGEGAAHAGVASPTRFSWTGNSSSTTQYVRRHLSNYYYDVPNVIPSLAARTVTADQAKAGDLMLGEKRDSCCVDEVAASLKRSETTTATLDQQQQPQTNGTNATVVYRRQQRQVQQTSLATTNLGHAPTHRPTTGAQGTVLSCAAASAATTTSTTAAAMIPPRQNQQPPDAARVPRLLALQQQQQQSRVPTQQQQLHGASVDSGSIGGPGGGPCVPIPLRHHAVASYGASTAASLPYEPYMYHNPTGACGALARSGSATAAPIAAYGAADLNKVASAAYNKALNDAMRLQLLGGTSGASAAGWSSTVTQPTPAPVFHSAPIIIHNNSKAVSEAANRASTNARAEQAASAPPVGCNNSGGLSLMDRWLEVAAEFWRSRLNRVLCLGLMSATLYLYWEWSTHRRRLEVIQRRIDANPLLRFSQMLSRAAGTASSMAGSRKDPGFY